MKSIHLREREKYIYMCILYIYICILQYVFPLFVCKCHSWCSCCLRLTLAYLGYQATLGTEKVTLRCFHFHWQQHFPHNTAASDKSGYMLLRVTPVTSTTITTSSKFSHATFNTHLGTKKRYALNSFNTKATTTWTRRTSLALSHRHAEGTSKTWCHLRARSRYIDVGTQLAHDPSGIGNAHTLHCN